MSEWDKSDGLTKVVIVIVGLLVAAIVLYFTFADYSHVIKNSEVESAPDIEEQTNSLLETMQKAEYVLVSTGGEISGFYITNDVDTYTTGENNFNIEDVHNGGGSIYYSNSSFSASFKPIRTANIIGISEEDKKLIVSNTIDYLYSEYTHCKETYQTKTDLNEKEKEFVLGRIKDIVSDYNSYMDSDCSKYEDIKSNYPTKIDEVK